MYTMEIIRISDAQTIVKVDIAVVDTATMDIAVVDTATMDRID